MHVLRFVGEVCLVLYVVDATFAGDVAARRRNEAGLGARYLPGKLLQRLLEKGFRLSLIWVLITFCGVRVLVPDVVVRWVEHWLFGCCFHAFVHKLRLDQCRFQPILRHLLHMSH